MAPDNAANSILLGPEPFGMTEDEAEVCYRYMPNVTALIRAAAGERMAFLGESMKLYRTDGLDLRSQAREALEQARLAYEELRVFGRG